MTTLSFNYSGGFSGTVGDQVVCTITGATPGTQFLLWLLDAGAAGSLGATADGSGNATITKVGILGNSGDRFAAVVFDDNNLGGFTSFPTGGICFVMGTAGSGVRNLAGTSATWDHVTGTTVISYTPFGSDTDIFEWWDDGFSDDPGGTLASQTMSHNFGDSPDGDLAVLEWLQDSDEYGIAAVFWYYAGSDTVHTPSAPLIDLSPTHGCPGQTITMTGDGFAASSALTATFDGNPLTLSPSTTDGSGNIDSTFIVPSEAAASVSVQVTDGSSHVGIATFTIDSASITLSPAARPPGTTVTVTGSCWCPDSPIAGTWTEGTFGLPGYFSDSLDFTPPDVASDGTINSTFVVPGDARPGDTATVLIGDGCQTDVSLTFTLCETPGGDYDWYSTPGLRSSTDTESVPTGLLLDWTDTATDFWLLFHRDSTDWSGTTFPPADDSTTYPLEVHQIPKDGSSITVYPCGTDLAMHWDFDSQVSSTHGTPGCFLPGNDCANGGIDCTPGNTGYWWRMWWWFTGWRKRVLNARLATDGTNVWVAAIATETEVYPFISTLDTEVYGSGVCPLGCTTSIADSASQFVDLSTITSGFTMFVTDPTTAGTGEVEQPCGSNPLINNGDYQRWAMFGNGPLGLDPRRGNESDAGDNFTGYYQQPKLVLFALDSGSFVRIGDDISQFVMGFGTDFYAAGTDSGGVGGGLETEIGWLSLTASTADPGVCHAVWSEQGAYGTRHKYGSGGHPDDTFDVWDTGSPNIGARVSYSRWTPSSLDLQSDLWTGSQDRTAWFFVSDPGSVPGNFSSGPPPGMNYSDQFELKNEHGSPSLVIAFESLETHDSTTDPGLIDSGTQYRRSGSDVTTLAYYDVTGGSASLLQTFDTSLLPTQSDLENVFTVNGEDPSPITHGPENIDVRGYLFGAGYVFEDAISTAGLNTSRLYHDLTLGGGTDVYAIAVQTRDRWEGTGTVSITSNYYRIPCDGSDVWDYVQGDRDLAISPTITRWGTTVGVIPLFPYAWNGLDFAIHAQGIWGHKDAVFPNDAWARLDFICGRWWESLWFPSDEIPSHEGSALIDTHGSPIFDPGAGTIMSPGKFSTSPTTDVFGIISTPIVLLNCACAGGLHVWQRT